MHKSTETSPAEALRLADPAAKRLKAELLETILADSFIEETVMQHAYLRKS